MTFFHKAIIVAVLNLSFGPCLLIWPTHGDTQNAGTIVNWLGVVGLGCSSFKNLLCISDIC